LRGDPALAAGLNTAAGRVTHRSVSEAHGLEFTDRSALVPA
jgi:alanine dehydrogenase